MEQKIPNAVMNIPRSLIKAINPLFLLILFAAISEKLIIPIKVVSDDIVCLQDEKFTGFQSMVNAIMKQAEITVRVDLGRGSAAANVYTCDFSYDYVKINADYRS